MNILGLFPTPVGQAKFEEGLSREELEFIELQETKKNSGNVISKNKYVFESPELKRLKDFAEEKLQQYWQEVYKPSEKCNIYITQSWCNYTKKGEYHHEHTHPNSIVSGVFYIKTDKDDKITFHNQKHQTIKIQPQEYNPFNSPTWWLETPENFLLLFPSSLTHHVPPVESDHVRISIAFNTFVSGDLGDGDEATGLVLQRTYQLQETNE